MRGDVSKLGDCAVDVSGTIARDTVSQQTREVCSTTLPRCGELAMTLGVIKRQQPNDMVVSREDSGRYGQSDPQ
jgi:hypothetical protein